MNKLLILLLPFVVCINLVSCSQNVTDKLSMPIFTDVVKNCDVDDIGKLSAFLKQFGYFECGHNDGIYHFSKGSGSSAGLINYHEAKNYYAIEYYVKGTDAAKEVIDNLPPFFIEDYEGELSTRNDYITSYSNGYMSIHVLLDNIEPDGIWFICNDLYEGREFESTPTISVNTVIEDSRNEYSFNNKHQSYNPIKIIGPLNSLDYDDSYDVRDQCEIVLNGSGLNFMSFYCQMESKSIDLLKYIEPDQNVIIYGRNYGLYEGGLKVVDARAYPAEGYSEDRYNYFIQWFKMKSEQKQKASEFGVEWENEPLEENCYGHWITDANEPYIKEMIISKNKVRVLFGDEKGGEIMKDGYDCKLCIYNSIIAIESLNVDISYEGFKMDKSHQFLFDSDNPDYNHPFYKIETR